VAAFYFVLSLLWMAPLRLTLDLSPFQAVLLVFFMLFMGSSLIMTLILRELS
jgi:hypothetical protein